MIIDFTPFSIEQNLFKAYSECMSLLGDDDYGILRDADTIYTTPNYMELIYYHTEENPSIGCFTCLTNRVGCDFQKDPTAPAGNDYQQHRKHGVFMQKTYFRNRKNVTALETMSGFFMIIKKSLWDKIIPPVSTRLLDVDTHIHRQIRDMGEKIYLLSGLYIYHFYTNFDGNGIRNTSHLK